MSWNLIMKSAITNFLGLTQIRSCEDVGDMLCIPITVSIDCDVYVLAIRSLTNAYLAYDQDHMYITTTQTGIDPDTGIPTGTMATYYSSAHGKYWHATAGTNYYIYLPTGYDDQNNMSRGKRIYISAGNKNTYGSNRCSATVSDRYGRTQGTVLKALQRNEAVDSSSIEVLYQVKTPVYLMWVPYNVNLTYSGTTYKWAKFRGWYEDSTYRTLISNDPCITIVDQDVGKQYYGLVDLEDEDFDWTTTIASGYPCQITKENWNDFICYEAQKANIPATLTYFFSSPTVDYVPRTFPIFEMDDDYADKSFRTGDNLFTARRFNLAKTIADTRQTAKGAALLPPTSSVSTGDIVYATYINNLLTEAR